MRRVILTVLTILFLCPSIVNAENVAKIKEKEYETLQKAIDEAVENDEILLLSDEATSIKVSEDKNISLNLNSHSFNSNINNSGKLEIKGPGKLIATTTGDFPVSINNQESGELFLNNLNIDDLNTEHIEANYYFYNSGKLSLEEVTLNGESMSYFILNIRTGEVTIKNGNYTTQGVFLENRNLVTIEDGTYNFNMNTFHIRNTSGTFTINNGNFTSNTALIDFETGSSTIINNGVFNVKNIVNSFASLFGENKTTIEINNGTFNTIDSALLFGVLAKNVDIIFNNGTITSNTKAYILSDASNTKDNNHFYINGGVIDAKNSEGILFNNITIGKNDDNVTSESPLIYINSGNFKYGYREGYNLNFYDGKIILNNIIEDTNITTPQGYYVKYDDNQDNTYTAYLSNVLENNDPKPETPVDPGKTEDIITENKPQTSPNADKTVENPQTGFYSVVGIIGIIVLITIIGKLYYRNKDKIYKI